MSGAVLPHARPRGRPRKDSLGGRALLTPPCLSHNLNQHLQQQQPQHIFHHPPPQLRIQVGQEEQDEQLEEQHHHRHQQQQQQEDHTHQHVSMEEEEELLVQQKKKEIKRSWREEWKVQHKWVYPITKETGELRLKCQWCTMYNMDNVFAKEGCSTIQLSALNTHAKSEAHKTAESRWESSDASMNTLNVPDNLWGFGSKVGNGESDGMEGSEMTADMNRKRKFVPHSTTPVSTAGAGLKPESLASILSSNNNRIVEILLESEMGRNNRHAVEVSMLKEHYALEEKRQKLDNERLQFERRRHEALVKLGEQYNAALTSIGTGLFKIGAALEHKNNNNNN